MGNKTVTYAIGEGSRFTEEGRLVGKLVLRDVQASRSGDPNMRVSLDFTKYSRGIDLTEDYTVNANETVYLMDGLAVTLIPTTKVSRRRARLRLNCDEKYRIERYREDMPENP